MLICVIPRFGDAVWRHWWCNNNHNTSHTVHVVLFCLPYQTLLVQHRGIGAPVPPGGTTFLSNTIGLPVCIHTLADWHIYPILDKWVGQPQISLSSQRTLGTVWWCPWLFIRYWLFPRDYDRIVPSWEANSARADGEGTIGFQPGTIQP